MPHHGPRRFIAVLATFALAIPATGQEPPTSVVKVLRTSNKAQTNRYLPRVYEFEHVNPYAVIRYIRRTMEIEEGAWFSFANEDLSGGRLLVVCPEYQAEGLDQLVALIDREGLTSSNGTKRDIYRMRHREATDQDLIDVVALEGTPSNVIVPDTQINSWMIEDSPSGYARMTRAVAERYDQPSAQLEAHLTVYEVDLTNDGRIGLDYVAWKNGPGRNLFAVGAFAQREKISTLNGGPGALPYNSGKGTFGLPARTFPTCAPGRGCNRSIRTATSRPSSTTRTSAIRPPTSSASSSPITRTTGPWCRAHSHGASARRRPGSSSR